MSKVNAIAPHWGKYVKKHKVQRPCWEAISIADIQARANSAETREWIFSLLLKLTSILSGTILVVFGGWRAIEILLYFIDVNDDGPCPLLIVAPLIGAFVIWENGLLRSLCDTKFLGEEVKSRTEMIWDSISFAFLVGLAGGWLCSWLILGRFFYSAIIGMYVSCAFVVFLAVITWLLSSSQWPAAFKSNLAFLAFSKDVQRFLQPPINVSELIKDTPLDNDPEKPVTFQLSPNAKDLATAIEAGLFQLVAPCHATEEVKHLMKAWLDPKSPPRRWWINQAESIRQRVWQKLKGKKVKRKETVYIAGPRCKSCNGRGVLPERVVNEPSEYVGQKWVVRRDGAEFSAPIWRGGGRKVLPQGKCPACGGRGTLHDGTSYEKEKIVSDIELFSEQLPKIVKVIGYRAVKEWGRTPDSIIDGKEVEGCRGYHTLIVYVLVSAAISFGVMWIAHTFIKTVIKACLIMISGSIP